jgi:hypothetical protein
MEEDIIRSLSWCVFRNLVQATYREARHLGPTGDPDAKVTVDGGPLLASAVRCRNARAKLKSTDLHKLTSKANTTGEVLKPYQQETGLALDDLISVFRLTNWRTSFGGAKWAAIAVKLKDLVFALDAKDIACASRISDSVSLLHHNNGPLIPGRLEWERHSYLREKWPELCN